MKPLFLHLKALHFSSFLFAKCIFGNTKSTHEKICTSHPFLFLLSETFAINDKIRLGFVASPGMGWFAPKGNDLKKGTVQFAMNYGVVVDYYFKDQNYGIQSGLFGGIDKGQLSDRLAFTTNTGSVVKETYNNQYLAIPLYLKLKTNSIKGFSHFRTSRFYECFHHQLSCYFRSFVERWIWSRCSGCKRKHHEKRKRGECCN
jgi:hypothetical protein